MLSVKTGDTEYLSRALRIAAKGIYTTHPNPRVGCVLVKRGRVIGEGYHLRAGEEHAEAIALKMAGDQANGCTAYVTLEPCSFKGRTPSCALALIKAGVKRVVSAMKDPDPRNAGAGHKILQEAGIQVTTPLLEKSARALNPGHIKRHETGMPYVRVKLAMSLDGKTALANGESRWITGEHARKDVQRLRARSSAIVTGVQTVMDDNPSLKVRSNELDHEHARLAGEIEKSIYILDSNGRIGENNKLTLDTNAILVSCVPIKTRMQTLQIERSPEGRVNLLDFLTSLARSGCNEVLFECGATLAGSVVQEKLFDELIFYIAPKLMGNDAKSLLKLLEIDNMQNVSRLQIKDVRMVGDDLRVLVVQG